MERCDCEYWQCLALTGELPANQKCPEGRKNYCPTLDGEVRKAPTWFIEHCTSESLGG